MILGIDASRNRSGGAKAHLIGIFSSMKPQLHGITAVHVWAPAALLQSIPNRSWLFKHSPPELEHSLASQLFWQAVKLTKALKSVGCDILFSTDASTLCYFRPMVVLSQDMLSYEPGVMQSYPWGRDRARLEVILRVQNAAFKRAEGVLFLTAYASKIIQSSCGLLKYSSIVPHGVSPSFLAATPVSQFLLPLPEPIRCLYVSPISRYKHQWVVVQALEQLRCRGISIVLDLVGATDGTCDTILTHQIRASDSEQKFVRILGARSQAQLPQILSEANIFIFASSCENMPITLLEAMAVGLPIACSDRGPMPEVLADGGVYFDPENATSIANAVQKLILDSSFRFNTSRRAKELAKRYSWGRCAEETLEFISEVHQKSNI